MRAATRADVAVLVFARAPRPGRAKTRLVPRLGEWGAARLQERLTRRTLEMARPFPLKLHGTSRHGLFRPFRVPFVLQRGKDLGERMRNAAARALRRHRAVIIIGTDCPMLRAGDLDRAARWLRGGADAVLAPAEDGGYALIGLRRCRNAIFEGIDWGTERVFAQTRARLDRLGFRTKLLRTVWDLDRPEDLERLRSLRFSSALPRSARRPPGSPSRSGAPGRP